MIFRAELEEAVAARGCQIGDWQSKYDELKSRYDALISLRDELVQRVETDKDIHKSLRERITELEAMLNAAPKPDIGLHGKERESVLKLIIGMAVAGYRYDPSVGRSKVISETRSKCSTGQPGS